VLQPLDTPTVLRKILEGCSLGELGHCASGLYEVEEVLEKAREPDALSGEAVDMALSRWLTQ